MGITECIRYLGLHATLLKDIYLSQDQELFKKHAAEFYKLEGEILNHEKLYALSGMPLEKRIKTYHQLVPKNFSGVLVDVGCAEAELSDAFHDAEYIGVDASQSNLKRASEKRPSKKFVCGNATGIPLKDNSADVLVSLNMLEHLFSPEEALIEFTRVLKGNGYCIVSVPNVIGEISSPGHVRFWGKDKWEDLFQKHFVIEEYRKQNLIGLVFKEHIYKLGCPK
jgi:SAM-dependent methyltransferase